MINTADDLLTNIDFREFYRGLSPEQRMKVEEHVSDIGQDRGICRDFGINYKDPNMAQLRAVACYELGLLKEN